MLDNVVSIMEHTVAHISHPSDAFLEQLETNVVRLMLTGSVSVSVQFVFFTFLLHYFISVYVLLFVLHYCENSG